MAEGLAIVASILLAFGIQAWWEDSVDHREELRILSALAEEFDANLKLVEDSRRFHAAVLDAADALLAAAADPTPNLSVDSLDTLLGVLSWWGGASTFETGTLDAVVFGGQLPLIEDRELRSRIAIWPRILDDLAEVEAQDYDTYRTVWMPFLREHTYLPQISNAIKFRPGHPDIAAAPPVPALEAKVDHRSLLSSRAFQNTLLQKSWVQEDVLGKYPDLEKQMRDLVEVLETASGEM